MIGALKALNFKVLRGLDSAEVSALACHPCDPGSNPGVRMWQGSGRPPPPWFSLGSPVSSTTYDHRMPTSVPLRRRLLVL